jgi:hypothetical protein
MTLQEDIQCQHKETSKNSVAYSVAVDENTDDKDTVHFAGFIRDVKEDFQLVEELLELVTMK